MHMNIQVEQISSLEGTLILPCFEGCEKPPNKTMNDTDNVTRKLIKKILENFFKTSPYAVK